MDLVADEDAPARDKTECRSPVSGVAIFVIRPCSKNPAKTGHLEPAELREPETPISEFSGHPFLGHMIVL